MTALQLTWGPHPTNNVISVHCPAAVNTEKTKMCINPLLKIVHNKCKTSSAVSHICDLCFMTWQCYIKKQKTKWKVNLLRPPLRRWEVNCKLGHQVWQRHHTWLILIFNVRKHGRGVRRVMSTASDLCINGPDATSNEARETSSLINLLCSQQ